MMRMRGLFTSLMIALLLGGCSAVLTTEPIGEEPLLIVAEEWEGTWTDSEDFLEIRVVDSAMGRLEVAWIETDAEGFELERVDVLLRQGGEAIYANVLELP